MDLEDIRVSEISQTTYLIHMLKKKKKNRTKTKFADTKKRWMIARGRGWGMGKMGEGVKRYRLPVMGM